MELLHLALEPIGSRAKCNNSTARAIILTNALHSVHYPYLRYQKLINNEKNRGDDAVDRVTEL